MAINKNVFIHPLDKAALQALKAIPGFTQVLKLFMKFWSEENMHMENMAQKIRISEEQLPQYYNMLPPICEKLGIDIPDFYLELNPYPNAYTTGDTKATITITSGLLETIGEDLLPTVIAHECGHIACRHVLYTTMAQWILSKGTDLIYKYIPVKGANFAIIPLLAGFSYWERCSEFSADRAAILCDGTPDKTIKLCMTLAGFDKDIKYAPNVEAFFNQAKEYKELINKNALNKARELYQFSFADHPVHSLRAFEANEWSSSEDFIKSKQFFEAYNKDEKVKEFPINWNERYFIGKNYKEVEQELLNIGFESVELLRKTEKSLLTKEGSVINVDIGGTDKYKEGDWISADTIVEVTYYYPLTEEEIAAMHPGEIKMPVALKSYIGKPYEEVKASLLELGFEDITIDEVKDITKEKDKNEGKVASITIDKSPKYSKGDWVNLLGGVEIIYHSKK